MQMFAVRMHASFVVNTLFMKFLPQPLLPDCGGNVEYFPVMYMNTFKQQLCYNDNNGRTTGWIKVARQKQWQGPLG